MSVRSLAVHARPSRAAVSVAGALGVVMVLLLGAVGSQAPAVAVNQAWTKVQATITVRGHGYGHGHGMSQYGAYGAARQGLPVDQILAFYYPGTTLGPVGGRVRVLISGDTTDDVVVSPAAGLAVRDRGDKTTYQLPEVPGLQRWRLVVADGTTVVEHLTDTWRRWELPDGKAGLAGDGQFTAAEPLTLWTPAGAEVYRGKLRSATPAAGSSARDTINILRLDDYVKGVVPYEMPSSWHPEAVKAQAVAARTYAAWTRAQYRKRYYQICDTTACQVYGGVGGEEPAASAAVDATAKQVLLHEGSPAFTQFSSSSGGWTAAGSRPYLPAQADPYDGHDANPNHAWAVTVARARVEQAYPAIGALRRIRVVARDGNGEWLGRVRTLRLDGSRSDRTVTGDSFRWALGLRSTWFTID
jgi:SpoIID/LytB domain protein